MLFALDAPIRPIVIAQWYYWGPSFDEGVEFFVITFFGIDVYDYIYITFYIINFILIFSVIKCIWM